MTRAQFDLVAEAGDGTAARRGRLHLKRGIVETPVFMPVGTKGTVKGITPQQLKQMGASIILGNTYHLMLRPGMEVVEALGGLNRMAGWDGPTLTDSGGFQVFSLRKLSKITEEGVRFQSYIDGSKHMLSPERAVAIQEILGSDIMMAFDDCPPAGASRERVGAAIARTSRWAQRCIEARRREDTALFGIVQGGLYPELRAKSASELKALPFDGYAVGGLSVGESPEDTDRLTEASVALLPADKARYLMGVGTPEYLLMAVTHGVDMFDCVLPTRNGRNGKVFTRRGDINLRNQIHRFATGPIDDACDCYTCQNFSRGYLRHLDKAKEMLFSTLASIHNLRYLIAMMEETRAHISAGTFKDYRDRALILRAEGARVA